MSRALASFLLGGCVFATGYVAQRLIAPYAGLGLTLYTSVLAATLLGFALGAAWGAGRGASAGDDLVAARFLIGAAGWTLLIVGYRRPLLVALSGAELRLAVTLAALALAGLPSLLVGFGFAAALGEVGAAGALRRVAALLAGAACFAPLAGWVLVPRLGIPFSLAAIGGLEAIAAALVRYRRAPLAALLGLLAVLAASALLVTRRPDAEPSGPHMLALREGAEKEYRVFDRDGARYLLADGAIHAVVDTLSGDCVQRAPAALGLLRLMRPGRDSMLVLGLRGGALPLAFARAGWRVRVVEPDTDAVAASLRESYKPGELPLVVADPRVFLARDRGKHSVIVVDAFADSELPWTLCTREFVATLAERLNPDGFAIWIVEAHGWGDPWLGSLGATLHTRFAHVAALPTSEPPNALGTIVLVASRAPLPFTDDDLPDPKQYFLNPDALWGVQQLSHAWLNRYEPQPANAPVLTDDRSRVDVWGDRLNHAARAELHTFFGPHGGSW